MRTILDFTPGQFKFLIFLTTTLVVMMLYLFIRSHVDRAAAPVKIPVVVSTDDNQYSGIFVLDPNTAPADSLELLPGIGKELADRIIAYRRESKFESEIDIIRVNGIGPRTYERIKPYLKVQPWQNH